MKKTKIVVPALAVLLLSTAASVSGTVAWFSMNTSINVTGMTVTTKVSSSLQIAEHNVDSEFSNDDLPQAKSAILEPASTVNGNAFFYTTDAKMNGDANDDTYNTYSEATNALNAAHKTATGKDYYDSAFNGVYGFDYDNTDANSEVSFAYLDYSFYLRASIVGDSQKISMDKCNILYDGTALSTEWAWRVALFSKEVAANTEVADSTVTGDPTNNLVSILDLAKSKNQNEVTSEIIDDGDPTTGYFKDPQLTQTPTAGTGDGHTRYYQASGEHGTPKAISAGDAAPTAVQKPNLAANVASGVTGAKIYKVVVRLWLEGEDVSCTSDTFANLQDEDWSLNVSFKLGDTDGITNMTSDTSILFN